MTTRSMFSRKNQMQGIGTVSVLLFCGLVGCDTGTTGGTPNPTPNADAGATPLSAADRCSAVKRSVDEAGFSSKVTVTCDANYAMVASDKIGRAHV